jgi:hypothetical protein
MKMPVSYHFVQARQHVDDAINNAQEGHVFDDEEAQLLTQLIENAERLRENSIRAEFANNTPPKVLAKKYSLDAEKVWRIINAPHEVISGVVAKTEFKESSNLLELGSLAFTDVRGERIVEQMRQRLAKNFGVTVMGNWVTVRFSEGEGKNRPLLQVSMQIASVVSSDIKQEEWEGQ